MLGIEISILVQLCIYIVCLSFLMASLMMTVFGRNMCLICELNTLWCFHWIYTVICSHLRRWVWGPQWLRCCATNRKVAGSIPAGVNGFFIDIKSFRSHYGHGIDQPLIEMSTRSISWGKGGHSVPLSRNLEALSSWNILGLSRPVMELLYLYLLRRWVWSFY